MRQQQRRIKVITDLIFRECFPKENDLTLVRNMEVAKTMDTVIKDIINALEFKMKLNFKLLKEMNVENIRRVNISEDDNSSDDDNDKNDNEEQNEDINMNVHKNKIIEEHQEKVHKHMNQLYKKSPKHVFNETVKIINHGYEVAFGRGVKPAMNYQKYS